MMYGLISIDGEIVRAQNRPTVTVTESDAHSFLYTIEYPNAGPEKSSFRTLGGEDARPLVIEAYGPVNVEPAICAWALPARPARFGKGSAQVRTAHCYDTADESGSMLNFVGEDCATIVMNAGEPDVPNTGEDYDHPFSVTYECHRVPPAPEPETEG